MDFNTTPRPWKRGNKGDTIISDQAHRIITLDELEFYGGYVVCESLQQADLEFIIQAIEFWDAQHRV